METLPIAQPSDDIRAKTEQIIAKLIEMKHTNQQTGQLLLDWLRTEFDVQEPGKQLENAITLGLQAFVNEGRKKRPRTAKKLTPAALKALQEDYSEQIGPLQQSKTEALMLERKGNDLVNKEIMNDLAKREIFAYCNPMELILLLAQSLKID
ncbi:hypothetical protein KSF_004640 [Reticulibacter mediterranei]|uniref:Uncharacterized protein n=2 Tax=Reticulibacter mediterranei TaxID=2778369 RepID=A0A8J3I9J3_9CHLR|nr:hypothetical protein KSF_004640 [Reticulibacter mediterranei]